MTAAPALYDVAQSPEKLREWFGPAYTPGAVTPAMVADAITYLSAALGAPFQHSPASMGRRLMDDLMPRGMHRAPVEEWPAPALRGNTVADLSVLYDLSPAERTERRFVHAFDKNAQYLTACSSVELGLGDLRYVDAPTFDKRLPGYWLVGAAWVTTPELAWRHELVEPDMIQPEAAYLWMRHGRCLERWYARLRAARAALMQNSTPAGRLALAALKRSYAVGIAWLDGYWFKPHTDRRDATKNRPDRRNDPRYRPDWRHMIIATARANLQRTMRRLEDSPVRVVGAQVDCLFTVSSVADAREAADVRRLPLGPGLGQYKIKYAAVPLGEVEHVWREHQSAAALDEACRAWTEAQR